MYSIENFKGNPTPSALIPSRSLICPPWSVTPFSRSYAWSRWSPEALISPSTVSSQRCFGRRFLSTWMFKPMLPSDFSWAQRPFFIIGTNLYRTRMFSFRMDHDVLGQLDQHHREAPFIFFIVVRRSEPYGRQGEIHCSNFSTNMFVDASITSFLDEHRQRQEMFLIYLPQLELYSSDRGTKFNPAHIPLSLGVAIEHIRRR